MTIAQGSLEPLDDPIAVWLLGSTALARLANNAKDGTPRVIPMLFHWTGDEQGPRNIEKMAADGIRMARIAVGPTWVGALDFQTRLPGRMS